MRSFAFAALFAATALSAPAFAQDTAAEVNQAPFTGARVEGIVGWDRFQNNGHDDGVTYGVGVGYDVQFKGLLVGAEGEINDSSVKQCSGLQTATSPELCARLARDLYVGGRVGTVINDKTLLYVKAGYTNTRAKLTSQVGNADRITLGRDDLDGVRVGAGAEYALNQNMFLKAEYRYSNYEQGFTRHGVVGGFGFRF